MSEVPYGDRLRELARNYLTGVAKEVEAELGSNPQRVQRSVWMVPTGPSSRQSQYFERTVFDKTGVNMLFQRKMRKGLPYQEQLIELIAETGFQRDYIHYGALLPLVTNWLSLPNPFAFDESEVAGVLKAFSDFMIDGVSYIRSRCALIGLAISSGSLPLEEGIVIRPITEEELYDIGDEDPIASSFGHLDRFNNPSEDWHILDIGPISVERNKRYHPESYALREGVLVALRLLSPGRLEILDLGFQSSYGVVAAGRYFPHARRQISWLGDQFVIDQDMANRLQNLWPKLRRIMTSESHYLRLPAQRLMDGGSRARHDEAIIDYAIGLEALLTERILTELRYRFSLRGAIIMSWNSEGRGAYFKELQAFYDIRSRIVHGHMVDYTLLQESQSFGEMALRQIWWWYFYTELSLSGATSRVDKRILGHR